MKKNTPILKLNLAPKLKRPLSLFNPLDYLQLLYWVFYFPQAIRWYLETYGERDSVELRLIIQSFLIMLIVPLLAGKVAENLGISFNWVGAAIGVIIGVVFGVVFRRVFRVAIGVAIGVASGVASSVAIGVAFGMASSVAIGVAIGVASGVASSVASGVAFGVAFGVVFGVAFGVASGVAFGATLGAILGVVFAATIGVGILRPENWLLGLPNLLPFFNLSQLFPRVTTIPLPYLAKRLETSLLQDWYQGVENINQVLFFSLQFISVSKSVNQALTKLPKDELICSCAYLTENIYDLSIIYFSSASLIEKLKLEFIENIFIIPKFLRNIITNKINADLKFDTLVQVTAAIFWLLTQEELVKDKNIFNQVRSIPYGEEIFVLYNILVIINYRKEIEIFNNINLPNLPPEPYLYPTIWTAINKLYQVITEIQNINNNPSPVLRSLALNRAISELNEILENAGNLPRVGKKSIVKIAEDWKKLLEGIAKEVGTITITEEIPNPYIIGNPVIGKLFVGREDIIRRLREIWLNPNELQSVILYGHRRMGKTSILRNVVEQLADKIAVIHVNLLLLGSCSNGLADVLIKISADIEQQLNIEPPTDQEFLQLPERTFERYLKKVLKELQNHRLIIALDEFEKLETLMNTGSIPPNFMEYLRGLVQMDKKLGFALAGLHTLEEMTADYFAPFFASVINIKVGFLSYGATSQVLANPNDEFLISYNTDTLQLICQLTCGQPYLVQLIGFQLVSRYNDLAFELMRKIEPVFTVEDVNAIINEEFFQRGRYYFTGVWGQAEQGALGQQQIIKVLAPEKAGLSYEELKEKTQLTDEQLEEAINTLKRHDVIGEKDLKYSISVELFRRWVVDYRD